MTETDLMKWVWLQDACEIEEWLQCSLSKVVHDVESQNVLLFTPKHNRPDMRGAIAYAKRVSGDVKIVQIFEDEQLITVYVKQKGEWGDEWVCKIPPRK